MTLAYVFRLLCVCLGSFFLIHFVLGLLLSLTSRGAVRLAERMQPRVAARFLLMLRFLPFGFALFVVVGVCVPSYLRFEPENIAEPVGFACLVMAALALAVCGISIARGVRAIQSSLRRLAEWRGIAHPALLAGEHAPALVFEGSGLYLGLAGIFRPRLIVSARVLAALSIEELAVALRHERAHRISRDNLKRLLLLFAPGILPLFGGFDRIERAWTRFAEWAADDSAVAGDPNRSVSLAEALLRLARLGSAPDLPPLVTSLLADRSDLAARVERLLNRPVELQNPGRAMSLAGAGAIGLFCAAVALSVTPAALLSAHAMLERLIR